MSIRTLLQRVVLILALLATAAVAVPAHAEEDSGADHPMCWSNTLHKYVPC